MYGGWRRKDLLRYLTFTCTIRRTVFTIRACERGYIVPGPRGCELRGPGRVQVSALSVGDASSGVFMGLNLSEDLFFFLFCPSPNFGQKIGLNFRENFFLLITYFWAKNQNKKLCANLVPKEIWGPRYRPSYPMQKFLSEALFTINLTIDLINSKFVKLFKALLRKL